MATFSSWVRQHDFILVAVFFMFHVKHSTGQELQIHRFKRVCYLSYDSFSRHNPAGRLSLSQHAVDPYLCTHVLYTAFNISDNHTILPARPDDLEPESGTFARLNALKSVNPSLKVMVSIGGRDQPGAAFQALARSDEALTTFSENLVSFIRDQGLNGVEVDWQHPPVDDPIKGRNALTEILRRVRDKFVRDGKERDRPRLLLSLAISNAAKHIRACYDFTALNRLVDFMTLRSCDYHGSWELKTGMNSPLYPATPGDNKNIESSVRLIQSSGGRADLLVVALCAKGSSFTLVSDLSTDINSETSGPGIQGPFVQKLGTMAYFEVCVVLRENGQRLYHQIQKCPYLVRDRLWIGYDDPESIQEKTFWIVDNQLGGAALWTLDLDDFSGRFCKGGHFPLMSTMAKTLKAADVMFFQTGFIPISDHDDELEDVNEEKGSKSTEESNDIGGGEVFDDSSSETEDETSSNEISMSQTGGAGTQTGNGNDQTDDTSGNDVAANNMAAMEDDVKPTSGVTSFMKRCDWLLGIVFITAFVVVFLV